VGSLSITYKLIQCTLGLQKVPSKIPELTGESHLRGIINIEFIANSQGLSSYKMKDRFWIEQ